MWRHTTKLYGTAQKIACLFWLVFLLDDAKQVKSVNPICWRITHPSILAISHWLKGFSSWLNSNHKTIERGTCTHTLFPSCTQLHKRSPPCLLHRTWMHDELLGIIIPDILWKVFHDYSKHYSIQLTKTRSIFQNSCDIIQFI